MIDFFDTYLTLFFVFITTIVIISSIWLRNGSTPGVKAPSYLYLGFSIRIRHKILEALKKYYSGYGGCNPYTRVMLINDPELIREVLVKSVNVFPDRLNVPGHSIIRKAVSFLPGNERWKRMRGMVSIAFTSGNMKTLMANVSPLSGQFVNRLKRNTTIDVKKNIDAFTLDVMSDCVLGLNVDSLNNPEHPIVANMRRLCHNLSTLNLIISFVAPALAKAMKLAMYDQGAQQYFGELINKRVNERKESKDEMKTDFIQLMTDSKNGKEDMGYDSGSDDGVVAVEDRDEKTSDVLSSEEVTAQSIGLLVAGTDNLSKAITHAIYFVSQNIECQQRLYEELKNINEYSDEVLNDMKYLNAVINETLRLAPSVHTFRRLCNEEYELGNTGITLAKGTAVEISPYSLHRDPAYWSEPEKFNPDRFVEPTHHPWAYIPFGMGPRACVAQRFALNVLRMSLAQLIGTYEITPSNGLGPKHFDSRVSIDKLMVTVKSRAL